MKRKHFSQLPTNSTMQKILDVEEKRAIPSSKKNLHYPDFEVFENWLNALNIKSGFLHLLDWEEMMSKGRSVQTLVVEKTQTVVKRKDRKLIALLKAIEKYLREEDKLTKSDLIIVFGSSDVGRIEKAVRLFNQGYAKHIVTSGRSRFDSKYEEAEAVIFANKAYEMGVDKEKVLIEDSSVTIASNVRHSLNLLDEKKIKYNSIISLTAWFAQRRAWCHFMKYTDNIDIVRVNSDMDSSWRLAPENWYTNEFGLNVVFGEFVKMKVAEMVNSA